MGKLRKSKKPIIFRLVNLVMVVIICAVAYVHSHLFYYILAFAYINCVLSLLSSRNWRQSDGFAEIVDEEKVRIFLAFLLFLSAPDPMFGFTTSSLVIMPILVFYCFIKFEIV